MWDIILKIHAPDLDAPEQEFTIVDGVCNVESETPPTLTRESVRDFFLKLRGTCRRSGEGPKGI